MEAITADLGSIILAGGQSRRMGMNKALMRLEAGGPTLIERVVGAVAGFGPVLVVTNTPDEYAFLALPMVPDAVGGQGPLAGLLAGLEASSAIYNFVLACDMPQLKPALLRHMAERPRDYDVLVPRWSAPDGTEQIETLHAIYSKACIPAVHACLERGKRRMIGFYGDVRVLYLEEDELRAVDPDLSGFRNLNTPEDLAGLAVG